MEGGEGAAAAAAPLEDPKVAERAASEFSSQMAIVVSSQATAIRWPVDGFKTLKKVSGSLIQRLMWVQYILLGRSDPATAG